MSDDRVDRRFQDMLRNMSAARGRLLDPERDLQERGSESTSRPVAEVPTPDRDLMDAKIAAAEARTDTKFAEAIGAIRELKATVDAKPSRMDIWGAALAIVVGLLAALGFAGDRLSLGLGLADQRQEQLERDRQQDVSVREVNRKLDLLLARQAEGSRK